MLICIIARRGRVKKNIVIGGAGYRTGPDSFGLRPHDDRVKNVQRTLPVITDWIKPDPKNVIFLFPFQCGNSPVSWTTIAKRTWRGLPYPCKFKGFRFLFRHCRPCVPTPLRITGNGMRIAAFRGMKIYRRPSGRSRTLRTAPLRSVLPVAALCVFLAACGGGSGSAPAPSTPSAPSAPTGPPSPAGTPDLGVNASLNGARPFPDDNPWNTPIDQEPVDPDSDAIIDRIGRTARFHPDFGANWNGGPFGIPYIVVAGATPGVPVSFQYADESDPGPYPVPAGAPIEGGAASQGDRHILVIDRDNWKLYELFAAYPSGVGYTAGSGAVFDLSSNALRPAGWTSADAAGLPIFPGLVRYDEVAEQGIIRHALRFTASRTRRAYVHPARHFASSYTDADLPPMGMRVRLKAGFDLSGFPPSCRVILQALKTYGMILADNGGSWYVSGAPDPRWDDEELNALKTLTGNDFEVVRMGAVTTQ